MMFFSLFFSLSLIPQKEKSHCTHLIQRNLWNAGESVAIILEDCGTFYGQLNYLIKYALYEYLDDK